ncbi:MAG: hypothetical protein ABL949_17300 [Fimbriimonadaceae bacterium]
MEITCPNPKCCQTIEIEREHAGTTANCPTCGQGMQLPELSEFPPERRRLPYSARTVPETSTKPPSEDQIRPIIDEAFSHWSDSVRVYSREAIAEDAKAREYFYISPDEAILWLAGRLQPNNDAFMLSDKGLQSVRYDKQKRRSVFLLTYDAFPATYFSVLRNYVVCGKVLAIESGAIGISPEDIVEAFGFISRDLVRKRLVKKPHTCPVPCQPPESNEDLDFKQILEKAREFSRPFDFEWISNASRKVKRNALERVNLPDSESVYAILDLGNKGRNCVIFTDQGFHVYDGSQPAGSQNFFRDYRSLLSVFFGIGERGICIGKDQWINTQLLGPALNWFSDLQRMIAVKSGKTVIPLNEKNLATHCVRCGHGDPQIVIQKTKTDLMGKVIGGLFAGWIGAELLGTKTERDYQCPFCGLLWREGFGGSRKPAWIILPDSD